MRPFGQEGGAAPVSTDAGTAPRWSPDGRELFYRRGDAFLAVSVISAGGTPAVHYGRVFTLSSACRLPAHETASGRVLWEVDVKQRFGAAFPVGCASSPPSPSTPRRWLPISRACARS